jgi:integrative and conjugative element protein (TIGR02256 family)
MILSWEKDRLALVPDTVVNVIRRYAVGSAAAREAGGILIGCYRGAHMEVTECTTPFPADTRRRFLFDRKDPGHQRAAMAAWHRSRRTETFVGEWHTHPEHDPSPSGTDLATWRSILERTALPVLFLIGGSQTTWEGVGYQGYIYRAIEVPD